MTNRRRQPVPMDRTPQIRNQRPPIEEQRLAPVQQGARASDYRGMGISDEPFPMPAPTERRPISEILNPDLIKRAKDEYDASLPGDRKYAQILTETKYGGTFGNSRGRGFDAWFEENYINNPNSALSSQERMALQPYVGVPRYQMDSIGQRPQVSPGNYNDLMARQNYDNFMREQMAVLAAQRASGQLEPGRMSPIPDGPVQNTGAAPSPRGDFIDTREPGRNYLTDMVDYIDPATGENTSRTRGVVPAPGSRFVRVGSSMPVQNPNYDAAMARQTYNNLMRDQMAMYAAQQASASNSQFLPGVPPPPAPAVPQANPQAASNFANLTPGASVAGQQPSQPRPSQPTPSQPLAQPAAPFGGQRPRRSGRQVPNVGFEPIQAF